MALRLGAPGPRRADGRPRRRRSAPRRDRRPRTSTGPTAPIVRPTRAAPPGRLPRSRGTDRRACQHRRAPQPTRGRAANRLRVGRNARGRDAPAATGSSAPILSYGSRTHMNPGRWARGSWKTLLIERLRRAQAPGSTSPRATTMPAASSSGRGWSHGAPRASTATFDTAEPRSVRSVARYTACANVRTAWFGGGRRPTFRLGRVGVVVDAEALVRPVVEGAGFDLFDVTFGGGAGGRPTLRVTVDRDGGLDLDTIAALSDKIARRLDLESFGDGRYELEVSSPGIEHPLKTRAHFARAIGAQVRITTDEPVEDARVHDGVLLAADERRIEL